MLFTKNTVDLDSLQIFHKRSPAFETHYSRQCCDKLQPITYVANICYTTLHG